MIKPALALLGLAVYLLSTSFSWVLLQAANSEFTQQTVTIVTTVIGGALALGATQILKTASGACGVPATILSLVVSLIVAVGAVVVTILMTGDALTFGRVVAEGALIYMLANLAYKLFLADNGTNPVTPNQNSSGL